MKGNMRETPAVQRIWKEVKVNEGNMRETLAVQRI